MIRSSTLPLSFCTALVIGCLLAQPAVAQKGKPPSLQLTVTLNANSVAAGGALSGTISHNNTNLSSAVNVNLTCSPTDGVTFDSASVTIAAGQSTTSFAGTAGSTAQTVAITAAASGYKSGSATLTVTPPPPPGYEIKYIYVEADDGGEVSYILPREVNGMNNLGQTVGWYYLGEEQRAYLYDPLVTDDPSTPVGEAWDLSRLVDPLTIDPYLTIASAVDINAKGDIVGYVQPIGGGYVPASRQAFAMRWNADANMYSLQIIPSADGRPMWGRRINETGDVLCNSSYEPDGSSFSRAYLYNPGWYGLPMDLTELALSCEHLSDVLTDGNGDFIGPAAYGDIQAAEGTTDYICYRILPWSGTIEQFDFNGRIRDVNGDGVFCGTAQVEVLVRKRVDLQRIPYLYDNGLQQIGEPNEVAARININQDVLVQSGQLYHSNFGVLKLDDLVTGTDSDVSYWLTAPKKTFGAMNDRASDVTGEVGPAHFGQICGKLQTSILTPSDYRIFVLTPVAR